MVFYCCAARSEFFLRAEPERSEGGLSEEVKNREGVASGSATRVLKKRCSINLKKIKICGSYAKAPSHEKHFAPLDVRGLICGSYAKAPSHEKHFAPLDVRGLWHARPLPTASALDKSRPAAAQQKNYFSP